MYLEPANIIYFILRNSMLFILFYWGNKINKNTNSKQYWQYIFVPLLTFTLNEGLRWGRGIDYNSYYYTFKNIAEHGFNTTNEIGFSLIIQILNALGLNFQALVLLMSFTLIFSAIFLLKHYKEAVMFSLPLFATYTLLAENLMRWYFAFSFFIIGLYYLIQKKNNLFLLFCCIGVSIHYASIIYIPLFYLVSKIKKIPIKPIYACFLFIFIYIFFSQKMMGQFTDFLQQINLGTRFLQYQENAEYWLTDEGKDLSMKLSHTDTINALFVIVLGYKIIKYYRPNLIFIYNITLIGLITAPAMAQIELLARINSVLTLFQYIILAYIFKLILVNKIKVHRFTYIFTWIILLNFIRGFITIPLTTDPNHLLYIWDANGRAVLDVDRYY